MKNYKILAINPGSTSTKISVFHDEEEVFNDEILHDHNDLKKFEKVIDQKEFRYRAIANVLEKSGHELSDFSIIMTRGGILRPTESGIYEVNETMLNDFRKEVGGEHASNVGSFVADKIRKEEGIPAYIVDPITVDEMVDKARISGFKGIQRNSQSHALNIRRVSYLCADKLNSSLDKLNFIVAHLGGGISIGALREGRLIDVESANYLGPFSPERSGALPIQQLIDLATSGEYTGKELKRKLLTEGGVYSYLNTKDIREVEKLMESGNQEAELILNAMAYQISKAIGEMAIALKGKVDRIIITGGIAHSDFVFNKIQESTSFIAKLERVPGEAEMLALQEAALRLLRKEEKSKVYGEVSK